MAERGSATIAGALVWFFKDLWPGAGWGIVDARGRPKAAYYAPQARLAAAGSSWSPTRGSTASTCTRSTSAPSRFRGELESVLYRDHRTVVARAETPIEIAATVDVDLGSDDCSTSSATSTYAYRFGPPEHDVVVATLYDEARAATSEAFHFVNRRDPAPVAVRLEAEAGGGPGPYRVTLVTDRLLEGVRLRANGYLPDDNYFHLAPRPTKDNHVCRNGRPGARLRGRGRGPQLGRGRNRPARRQPLGPCSCQPPSSNRYRPSNPRRPASRPRSTCRVVRGPLFAWLHPGPSGCGHAVVFCPPAGHEQVHAHRAWRHLAEAVAGAGLPVLRFDYHGTGDSAGTDEDPHRLAAWRQDVRDAIAWVRSTSGASASRSWACAWGRRWRT